MKKLIIVFFVLGIVSALKPETAGKCPASNGLVGICVFIPGVNCLHDAECSVGKKCCSQGCGKVCKLAVTEVHAGVCPVSEPIITTCLFVKGLNCVSDADCQQHDKCCSYGCGKICKTANIT